MKKIFKPFIVVWIVCFVLFNAITFLIPNEIMGVARFDKPMFWIAYVLVLLSFLAQLITFCKFAKEESKEKVFLSIPLVQTSFISVIVSVLVGTIFMVIPIIPTWIGAFMCLLVAGYFIIACVKAGTVATIVSDIDTKIKEKTVFIRLATADAQNIFDRAENGTKEVAKKVYEALRYSDPMSNELLKNIEEEIDKNLRLFKKAVTEKQSEKSKTIAEELLLLIKERNSKCRMLK